jgi:hypothetical protein
MIPYVDCSASQRRGRRYGPGAARHLYRHPGFWESVRLRVIEPEQPQPGYGYLAPGYLRDEMNRLSFRPKTDGFTSPARTSQ